MTDVIDTKTAEEGNVAALPVRAEGGLIEQAAPTSEIVRSFNNYQDLYDVILIQPADERGRPNPNSDFQVIAGKKFPTKSAFRKLATAFVVTTRILSKEWEFEGPATGRRRKVRFAVVTAEAEAPNGRKAEGIAACDVYEKCIDEGCPSDCERDHGRRGHIKPCAEDCPGTIHFSHPTHDLLATAATRAVNRACSDLFGMGQVSAEEVDRQTGEVQRQDNRSGPDQQVEQQPAPPMPEGFGSDEEAKAAHQLADQRARKLPANLRGPFRHYRDTYGWPMSKAKLDEFDAMLADAEKQQKEREEHGGYKKQPDQAELDQRAREQQERIDAARDAVGAGAAQEHVQQGGVSAVQEAAKGAEEMAHDTAPAEGGFEQTEAEAVAELKTRLHTELSALNLQSDQTGALLSYAFGAEAPVSMEELDGPSCIDMLDVLEEIRDGRIQWSEDGWAEAEEGGDDDADAGPQPGTRRAAPEGEEPF